MSSRILARGTPAEPAALEAELIAAARDDGRLIDPMVLVTGQLVFPFDEIATLKAMVAAATHLASADPSAMEAVTTAKAFVASPPHAARAIAAGLTERIRNTTEARGLAPRGHLDEVVTQALLSARAFQQRTVFGGPHTRAYLGFGAGADGSADESRLSPGVKPTSAANAPVYSGPLLSAKLPAAERLRVRLLVRVHPGVDPAETHALALYVVAMVTVTRALPLPT